MGGNLRIYLIGFMGCGKSHWGQLLSEKLKIPFFDLDEKIIEKEGKSINEIFGSEGEERFRLLEKEVLYMLTESHESFVMATGGGTPCYFKNIDYMKKNGTTIWINSAIESLYNRLLKEKDKRPLLRNLTDEQLKSYIIKKAGDRRIYYQQASIIVNENEEELDKIVNKIFQP